ncbi:HDIG domain-containing metalloprotein [Dactylosporangium sp. NPDC051485]|uniref:HDIG domain-containing metalloprotein n=1 Tax=Dactylosporangium sp. NPDC051485 TaxID=3154846 RepID=UPI0034317118
MEDLVVAAAALAQQHLDIPELGSRWRHVQAVGARADDLTHAINLADRTVIVAAAWLHDLGYAPDLVDTGMHAIDGARHLQRCGYPRRVIALVAHHSGSRFEAAERGLTEALAEFPYEDGMASDVLATADLTAGPQGQPMTFDARLDEILHRYPPHTPVHKAMRRARPELAAQIRRVAESLQQVDVVAAEDRVFKRDR